MVALGASLPFGQRGYRAGLEATLTSGTFHSRESRRQHRSRAPCAPARSCLGGGTARRRAPLAAGAGRLQYWPADRTGIFGSGGALRIVGGAGLDYRRPALSRWDLMVSARYDLHRFTTDELESRGFSQAQGVSRVSLSLGLSRRAR